MTRTEGASEAVVIEGSTLPRVSFSWAAYGNRQLGFLRIATASQRDCNCITPQMRPFGSRRSRGASRNDVGAGGPCCGETVGRATAHTSKAGSVGCPQKARGGSYQARESAHRGPTDPLVPRSVARERSTRCAPSRLGVANRPAAPTRRAVTCVPLGTRRIRHDANGSGAHPWFVRLPDLRFHPFLAPIDGIALVRNWDLRSYCPAPRSG